MNVKDFKLHRFWTWPVVVLLGGMLSSPGLAASLPEDRPLETIYVTAERPLYAFTLELQKRHPLVVTYEETAAGLPTTDATPPPLVVRYRVSTVTGMPETPAAVLEDAIATHEAAGSDVRFKLIEDRGIFHLVPAAARDAAGRWAKVVPLLDTPIAVPAGEQEVGEALIAIRKALLRATGSEILLAEVPVNWVTRNYVRLSGEPQTARALLDEVLAGGPFTWQLLYDRKLKGYVFRIQFLGHTP